jgi:predicted transcriptional regulator
MRVHPYQGGTKRTFQQALIQRLESDYGLLGSRRVLAMLAEDIQTLVDEFYPAPQRLSSGWIVFTGTKANGKKPHPRQSAGKFELVTTEWPLLTPNDLKELAKLPETRLAREKFNQRRLVRLIEYGQNHPRGPVLLTLSDLATLLGLTTAEVSKLIRQAREKSGKPLLTKGHYFDIGMKPTHKAQVIELYEQGADEADIARMLEHSQDSVGHYIRDYERVKLLLKRNTPPSQIPRLLIMQPGVVKAYVEMVKKYHPDIKINNVKDQNST